MKKDKIKFPLLAASVFAIITLITVFVVPHVKLNKIAKEIIISSSENFGKDIPTEYEGIISLVNYSSVNLCSSKEIYDKYKSGKISKPYKIKSISSVILSKNVTQTKCVFYRKDFNKITDEIEDSPKMILLIDWEYREGKWEIVGSIIVTYKDRNLQF